MPTPRRALLAAPALLLARPALAAWPERPLKLVVPYAAGGTTDMLGRLLAQHMGPRLGQTVVVENRGGAGGSLGGEMVANSPADGHTLLLASNGPLVLNPLIQARLPYDPFRQLAPIGLALTVPMLFVVRAEHPARTIQEFVALSKARPGAFSIGSAGTGSANHLAIELFNAASGAQATHVPYRGTGPMIPDLLSGTRAAMCDQITTALPGQREGKVRFLAITGAKRSPLAPEVPTLAEAGIRDAEIITWMGLAVTAPPPAGVVPKLAEAMRAAIAEPAMSERMEGAGAELVRDALATPEGFTRFIAEDFERMKRAVQLAGLKPE